MRDLSSSDPKNRSKAGRLLYQLGLALCRPILEEWRKDDEFRALAQLPESSSASEKLPGKAHMVVGIAVEPEHFEKIHAASGSPRLSDAPADQDVKEFELHLDGSVHLDILTTCDRNGAGPMARFLQKFGEGIQQIELYVGDIERATQILKQKCGLDPIYPATREGADGTRVNFFLAAAPNNRKALIELVEETLRS